MQAQNPSNSLGGKKEKIVSEQGFEIMVLDSRSSARAQVT